jgi:hypothetical protein
MCLQVASDRVEDAAEVGADQLERGNRGNGDQCGNQTVFDGRRAALVVNKVLEYAEH